MTNITDTKITARIPFLKGKMVLLVEDSINPVPIPGKYYWEEAQYRFKGVGYSFLFLPELLANIPPFISSYLFPGFDIPDASVICQKIRDIAGIGNKSGLLYKMGRNTYFKDLCSPGVFVEDAVRELLDSFHEQSFLRFAWNLNPELVEVEISESVDNDVLFCPDSLEIEPSSRLGLEKKKEKKRTVRKSSEPKFSVVSDKIEEKLDPNTVLILDEVNKLLRKFNLSLKDLQGILGYTVKLSRMRITHIGDIFLTDFKAKGSGGPIEVKIEDLTKMIYLFYLKHPEGVRIKELENHIDELMHLYMKVSGKDDKEAIRARILNHVAPYSNNVNVCMSRIKSAFINEVGDSVAVFYYIKGKPGEPYSIDLDRDYVLWDY